MAKDTASVCCQRKLEESGEADCVWKVCGLRSFYDVSMLFFCETASLHSMNLLQLFCDSKVVIHFSKLKRKSVPIKLY